MRGLQLSMQQWPGLVTDGRDQALIFDTPYRFFLVCAPEKRAKWRKKQFDQMGIPATYDEILADIIRRDESDTHNPANPLRSHPNAIVIDVTGSSSAKEVARLILCLSGLAQQRA